MLSDIKAVLGIFKDVKGLLDNREKPLDLTSSVAVAQRFVSLFENHNVKRSQIPQFFDHGLTLKSLKDDETLVEALTNEVLQDAADLFSVNREWLDGVENEIYTCHDFYKNSEGFIEFLDSLIATGNNLGGVLFVPSKPSREEESLLLIEECIGYIGDKAIYKNHICNNWIFEYWKCRAYLTACVAYAWEKNVYVKGQFVDNKKMCQLSSGEHFIGFNESLGGWPRLGDQWDPEYMALRPDVFLDRVDEGERGKISALQYWLELEEKGFMKAGLGASQRPIFLAALEELTE